MLASLEGKIREKNLQNLNLIIEVNSIGFLVDTNLKTLSQISIDTRAQLYTYLVSNEHGMRLFGFMTKAEKEGFELLLSVSGIGPKLALAILNSFEIAELIRLILEEDHKALSTAPGLGKKIAERLVLELKSKINKINSHGIDPENNTSYNCRSEILPILENLGFNHLEINRKLDLANQEGIKDEVESLLRFCLSSV